MVGLPQMSEQLILVEIVQRTGETLVTVRRLVTHARVMQETRLRPELLSTRVTRVVPDRSVCQLMFPHVLRIHEPRVTLTTRVGQISSHILHIPRVSHSRALSPGGWRGRTGY